MTLTAEFHNPKSQFQMDQTVSSWDDDVSRNEIVDALLRQAVASLKLHKFEEAKKILEEALECTTSDFTLLTRIYMYYGRICIHLKDDVKALNFFEHELSIYKLICQYGPACDVSRRLAELAIDMGNFSKAKRCAEDIVDWTKDRKEERQARSILVSVCLDGVAHNFETNPEERDKLIVKSLGEIEKLKSLREEYPDDVIDAEILRYEGKCHALSGRRKEADESYKQCVNVCFKTKQFEIIHQIYLEKAEFNSERNLIYIVDCLRNALLWATKFGNEQDIVRCKIDLANKLIFLGNPHEALILGMECLESVRKMGRNWNLDWSLLTVPRALLAMGNRRQAAHFILLGSVLTIHEQMFNKFYGLIDEAMNAERSEKPEEAEIELHVDSSVDTIPPNNIISNFVIKLEHATNVDTWKMIVTGIIEDQKKPAVVKKEEKENEEPIDFMDLICKMNTRYDDQRTELPASLFLAPRPVSSASKKTTKSHRLLPGLRGNLAKLQNMKLDSNTVNRLLKRSKKSKTSLHSTSTQGDDTRSDDVTVISK